MNNKAAFIMGKSVFTTWINQLSFNWPFFYFRNNFFLNFRLSKNQGTLTNCQTPMNLNMSCPTVYSGIETKHYNDDIIMTSWKEIVCKELLH